MEWFENDEIIEIARTIERFGKNEIAGKVVNHERTAKPDFPGQALDRLSEMGFHRGVGSEEIGGMNMSPIMAVVVLSKLAEASAGFAAIVAANYAAVQAVQAVPGGIELMKAMPAGAIMGISLIEDVADYKIAAKDNSQTCMRNICFPSPLKTDYTIVPSTQNGVMALSLLSRKDAGNCASEEIHLSGCDEMPSLRIGFADERIGLIKQIAMGTEAVTGYNHIVSMIKLYFSSIMQGNARAATEYALKYTMERFQTGRMIIEHQNVRKKIIGMEIKNQAMAGFVYRAAHSGCDHSRYNLYDMLFEFVSNEAEFVCNEAVQSLGGYGYMKEYGLEKRLRDVKTLQALVPTRLADWLGIRQNRRTA